MWNTFIVVRFLKVLRGLLLAGCEAIPTAHLCLGTTVSDQRHLAGNNKMKTTAGRS